MRGVVVFEQTAGNTYSIFAKGKNSREALKNLSKKNFEDLVNRIFVVGRLSDPIVPVQSGVKFRKQEVKDAKKD